VSTQTNPASGSDDPVQPLREAAERRTLRAWANAVDLALYREIRSLASTPERTRRVKAYSSLGEHGMLWFGIGATGWLLDAARRPRWKRATLTVAGAYVLSTSIKIAIGRQRPAVEDLPHLMATPTGLSFPSSHSSSSFAAAQAFGLLLPPGPLYVAAVSMALSRLYLGVHYPSDVAAGAALGTVVGRLGR
jgi:membrane-associated phospholipid phosphatase